jgi:hypothetical protein
LLIWPAYRIVQFPFVIDLRLPSRMDLPGSGSPLGSMPMPVEPVMMEVMPVEMVPVEVVTVPEPEGDRRTIVIRVIGVAVSTAGNWAPIRIHVPVPPSAMRTPAAAVMQAVHLHDWGGIIEGGADCR